MVEEYIIEFMKLIINGIEDFFDVICMPTKKYIETAFMISFGFLVFSVIALILEIPTFVQWQEAITSILLLFIIYLSSELTMRDIRQLTTKVKTKTKQITSKTKKKGRKQNGRRK